jgi:hypothetical protein
MWRYSVLHLPEVLPDKDMKIYSIGGNGCGKKRLNGGTTHEGRTKKKNK